MQGCPRDGVSSSIPTTPTFRASESSVQGRERKEGHVPYRDGKETASRLPAPGHLPHPIPGDLSAEVTIGIAFRPTELPESGVGCGNWGGMARPGGDTAMQQSRAEDTG